MGRQMHTQPDPLLTAGHITCGHCRTDSWPVAAEWFSDTLIAVEYDWQHTYGCPYRSQSGVILLDSTSNNPYVPNAARPRLCRGTTRKGTPCKAWAQPESAFCHSHNPIRQATQ